MITLIQGLITAFLVVGYTFVIWCVLSMLSRVRCDEADDTERLVRRIPPTNHGDAFDVEDN